jgi:enoyl-CoA hydratase/carnithine racemase
MAYTDILCGADNFVATITLNRPDKLNASVVESRPPAVHRWHSQQDRCRVHALSAGGWRAA